MSVDIATSFGALVSLAGVGALLRMYPPALDRTLFRHPFELAHDINRKPFSLNDLDTPDGVNLKFLFAPPSGDRAVVVVFHDLDTIATDGVGHMTFLTDQGYGVLLAEYRGYGGNPGTPSERGILVDAEACIRWARKVAPDSPIVALGEGLGCTVAIEMALKQPLQSLVLDTPYTDVRAKLKTERLFFPLLKEPTDRFDAIARARSVWDRALIIVGMEASPDHQQQATDVANAFPAMPRLNTVDTSNLISGVSFRRLVFESGLPTVLASETYRRGAGTVLKFLAETSVALKVATTEQVD